MMIHEKNSIALINPNIMEKMKIFHLWDIPWTPVRVPLSESALKAMLDSYFLKNSEQETKAWWNDL